MGGHGEGQADLHAARIALYRRVEKLFHTREVDDLVELAFDFGPCHAEDGPVEKNILATGQLGVEPGAHFQETSHAAGDFGPSLGWPGNSGQQFQERALARAVASYDAD